MTVRLAALALAVSVVAAFSLLSVAAPPAHADRCQPEELVTGSGTSPIPEDRDPRCFVMDTFFYSTVVCDDTKFRNCLSTLDARATAARIAADPAGFYYGPGCQLFYRGQPITGRLCEI